MQSIAKNDKWGSVEDEVTAARLQLCLDRLTEIMADPRYVGERFLPLYERLEREIAARQNNDHKLAAIRERARQLKGQRARRA